MGLPAGTPFRRCRRGEQPPEPARAGVRVSTSLRAWPPDPVAGLQGAPEKNQGRARIVKAVGVSAPDHRLATVTATRWPGKSSEPSTEETIITTLQPENLTEDHSAGGLAMAESKPAFRAVGLYAWVIVSLAILVAAALLGHVEDEQGIRADDTRQNAVVAD